MRFGFRRAERNNGENDLNGPPLVCMYVCTYVRMFVSEWKEDCKKWGFDG